MIKQASVAITTILGVALPLFAATLDPVSWGVYILFSIVVDFRLYFLYVLSVFFCMYIIFMY